MTANLYARTLNPHLPKAAIAMAVLAASLSTNANASWFDYLFGRGNTFTQFCIQTPGAGGIYAAAAPGYIYTHGRDIYGNALNGFAPRADIYNTGYLMSLSRDPLYRSTAGYPDVFSRLTGLLNIGY